MDDDGLIIAQRDTMPGGGLSPTSQWTAGELLVEQYSIDIPPTAFTPNEASWMVGLYNAANGSRASVTMTGDEETGTPNATGNAVRFGDVSIAAPPGSLPNALNVDFQDGITLAGYELSSRRIAVGDELTATLYWKAREPVEGEYVAFVHLLDGAQVMHGGQDETVNATLSEWPVGEVYTDTYEFEVPPSAQPGIYQLEIGLYSTTENDRLMLVDATGAEGADRLLLGPLEVVGE